MFEDENIVSAHTFPETCIFSGNILGIKLMYVSTALSYLCFLLSYTCSFREQPLDSEGLPKFCGGRIFIFEIFQVRKFIFKYSGQDYLFSFQCIKYLDWGQNIYLFSRKCRPEYLFSTFSGPEYLFPKSTNPPPQNKMVVTLLQKSSSSKITLIQQLKSATYPLSEDYSYGKDHPVIHWLL